MNMKSTWIFTATESPSRQITISIRQLKYTRKRLHTYWNHYKHYYKIHVGDQADNNHYKTFKRNLKNLTVLAKNNPTANFRINQFMHLTYEDFIRNYTGFDNDIDYNDDAWEDSYESGIKSHAPQLDWSVYHNAVTLTPKNQNGCKIGYVYSAIHALEIKLLIDVSSTTANDMKYMSIQQGWDCSNPKKACDSNGGLPHYVFRGLQRAGGIVLANHMEYKLQKNSTCESHDAANENNTKRVAAIEEWGRLRVVNEYELMLALNEYGPLTTGLFVSNEIKNYHSGIITGSGCGRNPANHAVLITGYATTEDGIPYWIIKNSWGGKWGEKGFLFLIRNKGACAIGQYLAYAFVRSLSTTTTTTTPTTVSTTTTKCDWRFTECDDFSGDDQ
ncbi:hypothetical protein O0L34_g2330 [Tuta absoluta]|nr:hypothetical protein O0L34_g2330 [Tuta absoluta]